MPKTIPALVEPALLLWAREEAGYSVEEAAERLRIPSDKLGRWENGNLTPTLRQAEKLAQVYHRPYAIFCLDAPPKTTPLAAEYRRLASVHPGAESPELRLALRQMLSRRQVTLNLTEELGGTPDTFELKIRSGTAPEQEANRLRQALGVTVETQILWQNEYQAYRGWREAVENLGVLVFQFGKVEVEEVRGISILDFPMPVIGINSREVPAAKPFTLLHELVHLALANANEESAALSEKRPASEWTRLEQFAERLAGAVLMPAEYLQAEPLRRSATVQDVCRLARRYKVTPKAMATRLMSLGHISQTDYRRWLQLWEAYLQDHPPRTGGGIATPSQKALNRNGQPFTRLVLDALTHERITPLEAARHLELGFPHLEALRLDLALARPSSVLEPSGT
jgi:Zn-dependent peptidase ImmA (M78 family)/DNA-binding XRE family transcriptional regulator